MKYSRKELISILELENETNLIEEDGEIDITERNLRRFKSELIEANLMVLESYSKESELIYDFLFEPVKIR